MTRTSREVLLHLLILAILVVALFPIFWMVLNSFKPMSEIFVRTPRVFASEYTLDNYRQVFALRSFPRNLFNSVLVATATSATAIPLGFLAAYAVVRYQFAGKSLFLAFLLILQMIPSVVLISPLARVVRFFQAYDTYHAVVFIEMGFAIPICTWLLIGFIKESCPRELDESAMMDGCGTLGILLRIVLPLARAGVVTVFLFVFLLSWESLMIPLHVPGQPLDANGAAGDCQPARSRTRRQPSLGHAHGHGGSLFATHHPDGVCAAAALCQRFSERSGQVLTMKRPLQNILAVLLTKLAAVRPCSRA